MTPTASVLVVCTGNVCRSPIAEGFLRASFQERFADDAPEVASAGTAGWEGSGADPSSVEAAAERGLDISAHRGRRLTHRALLEASVVLAMALEHRDAVTSAVQDVADRTFTLKELVRLLEALPPPPPEGEGRPVDALTARIDEAIRLRRSGFEGNPFDEDVADPLGMPREAFRAVAWELDEWCGRLVGGLFGSARARTSVRAAGGALGANRADAAEAAEAAEGE